MKPNDGDYEWIDRYSLLDASIRNRTGIHNRSVAIEGGHAVNRFLIPSGLEIQAYLEMGLPILGGNGSILKYNLEPGTRKPWGRSNPKSILAKGDSQKEDRFSSY